jgi:hypothetical protein
VDLYVESKCDPDAPTFGGSCLNGTTLLATKVDNAALDMADGLLAELEGIISDFNGQGDFKVHRVPVDAADASILCGNVALGNGVKVKVRGNVIKVINVNTVDASSVECRQAKTVRLEGTVQSNVNAMVTLLDVPVVTNDKTELDDLASVGDLVSGDAIELRGFVDGNGKVIAVRLELEDSIDSDDFIVQAPENQVTAVDQGNNTFKLLGVSVDTSVLQNDDFEGPNDLNIGRAAFYQALRDGTAPAVKAKGTYDSETNTLTAREVELEEND